MKLTILLTLILLLAACDGTPAPDASACNEPDDAPTVRYTLVVAAEHAEATQAALDGVGPSLAVLVPKTLDEDGPIVAYALSGVFPGPQADALAQAVAGVGMERGAAYVDGVGEGCLDALRDAAAHVVG